VERLIETTGSDRKAARDRCLPLPAFLPQL